MRKIPQQEHQLEKEAAPPLPQLGLASPVPRITAPGVRTRCTSEYAAEFRCSISSTQVQKKGHCVYLGGPAHSGKGFRACGVRGAWVVREGFKEEVGLWWGLRGGAGKQIVGNLFLGSISEFLVIKKEAKRETKTVAGFLKHAVCLLF